MLVVLRAISAYDQKKEDSGKPLLRDVREVSRNERQCE